MEIDDVSVSFYLDACCHRLKAWFSSKAVFFLSLISKHEMLRMLLMMNDGSSLTIIHQRQQTHNLVKD